jgi:polysaccharide biosynthesis transport protein
MSRNFELLQQIGREQELFQSSESVRETFAATITDAATAAAPAEAAPLPAVPAAWENAGGDEVTALVQRVFFVAGNENLQTVVFAGTEQGNGCTWLCARAAEALASRVSTSVCVVDANLRAPGLHTQAGIPNHHGLSDALLQSGPMSNFVTPLAANLSMVSCGSETEKAQGLLTSDRMRARLNELRSLFSYVLIDVSAMNASGEAVALGGSADGVVLVLKANSSRKETARGAVRDLQAAKVRVLGAVLNQRTFPIPQAIYDKL